MKRIVPMIAKTSILIAACGFLLSFAITFQSIGLSQGLDIGDKEVEECLRRIDQGGISFSVSGGGCGTYCYLSSNYGFICFLFFVILVAGLLWARSRTKPFMPEIFVPTLISLALMFFDLRSLLRTKLIEDDFFWETPRNAFAKLTISFDWIFVGLAILLFCLHAVSVILWIKETKKIAP